MRRALLAAALAVGAVPTAAAAWDVVCGQAGCSAFQLYEPLAASSERPYAGVLLEYGGQARVIVGSNLWSFGDEHRGVTIGLEVDEEPLSNLEGWAKGELVAVIVGADDVRRLAKGRRLRVSTLGARYTLSLDGSARAIAAATRETLARRARGAVPALPERRTDEATP